MKEGSFRSDLFYRLAVLHIPLPPLRERPGDILLFATRFIDDFNKSLGRNVQRVAPEVQALLLRYHWPGNVRELKNVIERAMILSTSDELLPAHLPHEISGLVEGGGHVRHDPWDLWLKAHPQGPISLDEISGRIEQHFVRWALVTS